MKIAKTELTALICNLPFSFILVIYSTLFVTHLAPKGILLFIFGLTAASVGITIYCLYWIADNTKKLINTLQDKHNNLEDLVDNIKGIVLLYDEKKKKIEFVSSFCEKLTGYKPQEYYDDPDLLTKLVHPDDEQIYKYLIRFSKKKDKTVILRCVTKSGEVIWTEQTFKTFEDKYIVTIHDITEQKKTEFALQSSEKSFRELFENANDIILLYELDDALSPVSIVEINKYGKDLLQICEKDQRNLDPYSIYEKKNFDFMQSRFSIITKEKKDTFETTLQKTNGDIIHVDINAKLVSLQRKKHIFLIARDITDRKKTDEKFSKIQMIENLNVIASGVAHDFNNILSILLGNISLSKIQIDRNSEVAQFLQEAEEVAYKARDLTQQLMNFAKKGRLAKEPRNINQLVTEIARFALRGTNATPHFALDKTLQEAEIDETEIGRVINNILINAAQAMPDGGHVDISSTNITVGKHEIPALREGNYLRLSFKDYGTGISEDNQKKLFTPFFTTKKDGNGLGLANCLSIINKHDGTMTLESLLGSGTTFHLYLPAAAGNSRKSERKSAETGSTGYKRKKTILMMDDEEGILATTKSMLTALGHKTLLAYNHKEAIEVFKEHAEEIDVVILDVLIPGGKGAKETLLALKEINPGIKSIVTTGSLNNELFTNFTEYGFSASLAKPFRLEELNNIIKKL